MAPDLEHAPELAHVVESDHGDPAGCLVAVADSDAFETWFQHVWWPRFAPRWPPPGEETHRQPGVVVHGIRT